MSQHQEFIIRPLGEADQPDWMSLWDQYVIPSGIELGSEVAGLTWRRLMAADCPLFGYAATYGHDVVGFALCHTQHSTWATNPHVYLEDLFVPVAWRGRGIARRLLSRVASDAGKSGAPYLTWLTCEDNDKARALYEDIAEETGFIEYRLTFD